MTCRKIYLAFRRFIYCAVLLALLCACGKGVPADETKYSQAAVTENSGETLKIAVASDLHIDPNAGSRTLVDPLYRWNIEIIKALLFNAQKDGADLLVITGDVTNGSRHEQHEMLCELLNEAKENGLKVLILDGNHDIGKTTASEFAEYYADFGYKSAYSRDKASLSYSIHLPQTALILVDTGGYAGENPGGNVNADTLSWLEKQFKEAQSEGLLPIVFGHYPLLTTQSGEFVGLDEMKQLLIDYRVPLYICGHMHGRHIEVEGTLSELVVVQSISYPCSYALISQRGNNILQYEPKAIDMEAWAQATNNNELVFLEFDRYCEIVFQNRCKELIDDLRSSNPVSDKQAERALQFYYDFQYALSNGHLFRELDNLKKHRGYYSFMEVARGSVYERWVRSTLEYSLPYSEGFIIIDNRIFSTAEGWN